jgi:hypothetical protein
MGIMTGNIVTINIMQDKININGIVSKPTITAAQHQNNVANIPFNLKIVMQ